jgi:hypothetical protein
LLLHNVQTEIWGPASFLFNEVPWVLSPRVKWLRREANHSPPSSVKVKNKWSYTSTPPVCLDGTYRGNLPYCTVLYILYFPTSNVSGNNGTHLTLTKTIYTRAGQMWIVSVKTKKKQLPNVTE